VRRVPTILSLIDGREVSREEVLAWETRRALEVIEKLGGRAASRDASELRRVHTEHKLALGHDGIERLLARELRWSARSVGLGAALSRGRRRFCTIELMGTGASVEGLPAWYMAALAANDEVPLIEACPDHYISRTRADGRQEIIETTGGAPLPLRMFFDDADTSTLRSERDASFPVEWTSVACDERGRVFGGIRHLFRDEPGGFRVRLTVEFPWATPPHMIQAHRWHLACEFSNWIEAANAP
jgi:hypothetical protein